MAVSLHFLWDGIFEAKVMQSRWQMPKRQEEAHRGIKEDVREKSDPSGSADFAGWAKHSTLEANSAHQPPTSSLTQESTIGEHSRQHKLF